MDEKKRQERTAKMAKAHEQQQDAVAKGLKRIAEEESLRPKGKWAGGYNGPVLDVA